MKTARLLLWLLLLALPILPAISQDAAAPVPSATVPEAAPPEVSIPSAEAVAPVLPAVTPETTPMLVAPPPVRVLISGGGEWHPYGQASGALIDVLRKAGGFTCTYSEESIILEYKYLREFDVVVLYNGVFYEGAEGVQKEPTPHFFPPSLNQFVSEGGGLVAVHSAVASYSDWEGYINLIGGVWDWKQSAHDPYGPMKSVVVMPDHPILEGIPKEFEFPDEFYHTLTFLPDIKVLIQATHEKAGQQVTEPLAWIARDSEKERVVALLHGHDMGSWGNDTFQRLMTNAIQWAARKR